MDVTIGVQNVSREISLDTEMSADEVRAAVHTAMAGGVLSLTDTKGREVLVAGSTIGWVQIGNPDKGRVGFGLT